MGARPLSAPVIGWALSALYFCSGTASLAYEVLWARLLSVQFGVSIFGVIITVCAFMAGLGLGSVLGTRASARGSHPLRFFALLECGVGLFALIMPWVAQSSALAIAASSQNSGLASWYGLQLVADFLLLLAPAVAMGAGFPLLLTAARNSGATLGRLYGINALGGVVGALSPLALLPALGWLVASQVFALTSIAIGVAAFLLAKRTPPHTNTASTTALPELRITLLYAAIGAAALMLEMGWTRIFGMILLRTEYVLAVIVAIFLFGIGGGSVIARHLRRPVWMIVLPVVACFGGVATLWLLAPLSRWIEATQFTSLSAALFAQGAALAAVTLPVTLALGAWLPLLTAHVGGDVRQGAWLYGANSIGAALGTLLAGFVLIPVIGTTATIASATLLLLVCGLALAQARRAWWVLVPVSAAIFPVIHLPPVAQLLPRALGDVVDLRVHEDALSLTHVIERADGQRLLLDDLQRMDASSDPDAVVSQQNQARLPLLLHPQPRSVLFLGMGTGISAAGALVYPEISLTAVELSRGAVLAASNDFAKVNGNIADHMRIVRDDARRFLTVNTEQYDVIVGDLFHPDLAGRSALLSVEQFQRARARLNADGVFIQWIALNQFDAASLDIVLRSFAEVFPQGAVFIDPFRLGLVGTRARVLNASDVLSNLARLSVDAQSQATGGEGPWTWLGRYTGSMQTLVTTPGVVQHEMSPQIEYLLPKARYRGELDLAGLLIRLLKQRPGWAQAADELSVPAEHRNAFERAYSATELALAGWVATLRNKAQEGERLLQLAHQANEQDRWIGVALVTPVWNTLTELEQRDRRVHDVFGKDKRDVLEAILKIRSDFVPALKALMKLEQIDGNTTRANALRARAQQLSPLDRDWRTDNTGVP